MAVNLPPTDGLRPVRGVLLATACANIKSSDRDDLVLVRLDDESVVAGVFTQSAFRAAPVLISEEYLAQSPLALLINSGNANAATGEPGLMDARLLCGAAAELCNIRPDQVLPFSTGVIGERLPVDRIQRALPIAVSRLAADGWESAARAIMTTDTGPKALSHSVEIDGAEITITGMAKGAGMIKPDMATMLGFLCCDANVTQPLAVQLLREVTDASFNRITVDGDTSTNDSVVLCATGRANHAVIARDTDAGYPLLKAALITVARELAQRIVRDGEGATKFVTVRVQGGADTSECLDVAYTVAESPLVKTAVFAGDPNWGRFCMAIGRAGVRDLDTRGVNLHLDGVCVARGGLIASEYTEAAGAGVMAQDEFEVRIELGRGSAEAVVWTTDLSYEYVRINAEYRT